MTHETLMAMNVTDDKIYQTYREHMLPILKNYGGGFRYDFKIAEVLKAEATHPITRVFAIYFKDKKSRENFFADPEYKSIREKFFDKSVNGFTAIAEYER